MAGTVSSRRMRRQVCGRIREVRVTTTSRPSVQDTAQTQLDDQLDRPRDTRADIVVKGRNVEVPDHFRIYVSEKLSRLERFDPSIFLFDVELFHERNRRQRKNCQRVEITARGKGPIVRAEACADSFYAAFEAVTAKLESRLRRTKDRRRVHYGEKTPVSVHDATADLADDAQLGDLSGIPHDHSPHSRKRSDFAADYPEYEGPGHIVRTKVHSAIPMTVDDALYQMELVGHDFFLFQDKETDRPSVVYRRHAFDYGLIRLA
jgi:ribosomal subunit interface protein